MSQEFAKRKAELQKELEDGQGTYLLQKHAHDLQHFLNQISSELAPHDLQKLSGDTEELLKSINDKISNRVENFQFKGKPKFRKRPAAAPLVVDEEAIPPVVEQDIILKQPTASYENLHRCFIANYRFMAQTGSLALRRLFFCTVTLNESPFDEGSILMTDCRACSIQLHTGRRIQIRLHNLQDCKLLIKTPEGLKQTIVMENCQNTIFHKSCEAWITVQEFDNLQLTEEKSTKYKFEAFDKSWQEEAAHH